MNIILQPRASGKTTELIRQSALKHIPIVVFNHRRAWWLAQKARKMGLEIPFPLSLDESLRHHGYPAVLIDDADQILQYIYRNTVIDTITLSE